MITGITGQDGSYLAEFLLAKGYQVHGIKRRASLFNTDRIDHLYQDPHVDRPNFILHYGDLIDSSNIIRLVKDIEPDEIYNLGVWPDGVEKSAAWRYDSLHGLVPPAGQPIPGVGGSFDRQVLHKSTARRRRF